MAAVEQAEQSEQSWVLPFAAWISGQPTLRQPGRLALLDLKLGSLLLA